jgi:hypothetical protein
VRLLPPPCVPIQFEFDEQRLGEVTVVYFHRLFVLCIIYCLTTERGELHASIIKNAVLSMGEDVGRS